MILQIEKMTPDVYVEQSRDFQLLGRLFDCIANGVKGDADSIVNLSNTERMMGQYLPLLQTKLGLIEDLGVTDDELRYILRVFPQLVHGKGSLQAIQQMLNMCLKIFNVNANFKIERVNNTTVINNVMLDSHSFLIGIDTIIKNLNIIKIISRYILPPGFMLYIYFYTPVEQLDDVLAYNEDVELLYASENVSSNIRTMYDDYSTNKTYQINNAVIHEGETYTCIKPTKGSFDSSCWTKVSPQIDSVFASDLSNRIVGAVDTIEVASTDSVHSQHFKGIFTSIAKLPNGVADDVCIVHNGNLDDTENGSYFYQNGWKKLNVLGTFNRIPTGTIANYSVIGLVNNYNKCYYLYKDSGWIRLRNRGSVEFKNVLNPEKYDFINPTKAQAEYLNLLTESWEPVEDDDRENILIRTDIQVRTAFYFDGTTWRKLTNYKHVKGTLPTDAIENDYVYVDGATYLIYIDGEWKDYTQPIYILEQMKLNS